MRVILVLAVLLMTCLLMTCRSVAAQITPDLYEPVLRHLQEQELGKPLVLNAVITKFACQRGCGRDYAAGTLSPEWLKQAQEKDLIADFCHYRIEQGFCGRPNGKPVHLGEAIEVSLTSERPCGDGCAEVVATWIVATKEGTEKHSMLYKLDRDTCEWSIVSATWLGRGFIN